MRVSVAYRFHPLKPTRRTRRVMHAFGVTREQRRTVIADRLDLPIESGQIVFFAGPSGSGKSSLLRAVAERASSGHLRSRLASFRSDRLVLWIDQLTLPDAALADALPLPLAEALELLSLCGLGEAQLLLRTPAELSDGQRGRFRVAFGLATLQAAAARESNGCPRWLVIDEFTAGLDRTFAKVLAFNVHRLARRTGIGFLLASTHDDIVADLGPDVLVRCALDGPPRVEGRPLGSRPRRISFHEELRIAEGRAADWQRFARWHYRGRGLAMVRRVTLLCHRERPIGICVFAAPAAGLVPRHQVLGSPPRGTARGPYLKRLNRRLWLLARVVMHPAYRGAGLAAAFVRESCRTCPAAWIETLSAMGQIHPFFERAGFRRIGVCRKNRRRESLAQSARLRAGAYGRKRPNLATIANARSSEPVYYLWDNGKWTMDN